MVERADQITQFREEYAHLRDGIGDRVTALVYQAGEALPVRSKANIKRQERLGEKWAQQLQARDALRWDHGLSHQEGSEIPFGFQLHEHGLTGKELKLMETSVYPLGGVKVASQIEPARRRLVRTPDFFRQQQASAVPPFGK